MSVIFDGNLISPAPFLTITRTKEETKGGRDTALRTTIRLQGWLVAHKGSPRSDGSFWTLSGDAPDESLATASRHTSLLTKQRALRNLLQQQNKVLEIQPWEAAAPTKFTVRLREITFPEGTWHEVCQYQATFDADEQGVTNVGVESLNETWSIEALDENLGTFRVSHQISVRGRDQRAADGSIVQYAWEHARDYALNTIGLGLDSQKMYASGVLNATSLIGYNYLRSQQLDEVEGTVSLGENWVAFNPGDGPAATHDQTIVKRVQADGLAQVTVEGSIQGLRTTDNSNYTTSLSKTTNAEAKWALVQPTIYAAATGWYGGSLHTAPLNYQLQSNQTTGQLSYNVEFSNRVTQFDAAAITERVEVRDTNAPDIYAGIVVPYRANGPVLQDIHTQGPRRRTVNIEVQMPAMTTSYTPVSPDTDLYVLGRAPVADYVFLDNDDQSFDEYGGRYSRTTTWTYTN